MTYAEKLKDPRWQKRRLEIMQRDNFTCCDCGETAKTLNVDHRVYRKGLEPWEYDDNDLWTLCEDCHHFFTSARQRITDEVGHMNSFEIEQLEAFLAHRTICDEVTVVIDQHALTLPRWAWNEMVTFTLKRQEELSGNPALQPGS